MSHKLAIFFALTLMVSAGPIIFSGSDYLFDDLEVPDHTSNVNGDGAVTCFDMGDGSAGQLEPGYPARGTPGIHIVFDNAGSSLTVQSFSRVVTTSKHGHFMEEYGDLNTYTLPVGGLTVVSGVADFTIGVEDSVTAGLGFSSDLNLKCYTQAIITGGFVNMNLNRYASPLTYEEDVPTEMVRMIWPNQNPRINKGINCGIIELLSSSFTTPFILALTALVALAF